MTRMVSLWTVTWSHRWLLAVLALVLPVLIRFWTPYPDNWDAAEYSWCLRKSYLPHSPYLVFFLAGRLLHLFWTPPVALALLSAFAGIGALVLFYEILWRRLRRVFPAALATLLLGVSGVFVREATHQEVYALQTTWLLLALLLSTSRPAWSGVVFGVAMATHSSSLFVAPALLLPFFVGQAAPADSAVGQAAPADSAVGQAAPADPSVESAGCACPTRRAVTLWLLGTALAVALAATAVVLMLPVEPDASRLDEGISYLKGINPSLDAKRWNLDFLARSCAGQLVRLFAIGDPQVSIPPPRYPVGFTALHLLAALAGAALVLRRHRSMALWILYPAPYLAYELLLGASPDLGAYLPLVAPAVCALAGLAVGQLYRRERRLGAVVAAVLLAPSALRIAEDWNRPHDEAVAHFSPQVLAALWLDVHLPEDAVVVNTVEPTFNAVAYYSGRQPIFIDGRRASIFRNRGAFTPVNVGSFEPLSTSILADLVRGGRWVVALDSEAFDEVPSARLDASRFVWREIEVIDLSAAAQLDRTSRRLGEHLVSGHRTVYRLRLAPTPPRAPAPR